MTRHALPYHKLTTFQNSSETLFKTLLETFRDQVATTNENWQTAHRNWAKDNSIESLSELIKNKSGLNALSTGILVAASNAVYNFIFYAEELTQSIEPRINYANFWEIGPRVKDIPWSRVIRAGGNYARHSRDWEKKIQMRATKDQSRYYEIVDRIISCKELRIETLTKRSNKEYNIIATVTGLQKELLTRHIQNHFDVATKLILDDIDSSASNYSNWISDCIQYMRQTGL